MLAESVGAADQRVPPDAYICGGAAFWTTETVTLWVATSPAASASLSTKVCRNA